MSQSSGANRSNNVWLKYLQSDFFVVGTRNSACKNWDTIYFVALGHDIFCCIDRAREISLEAFDFSATFNTQ